MRTLAFFTRTAWRNIRRGGQRALVALLCIAFGVMSLVSMTLVSLAYQQALVLEPGHQIGADISLGRREQGFISPEQVQELEALRQAGQIERYTRVAFISSLAIRRSGSGELYFIPNALGIETDQYPLAGSLVLSEPGNVGLSTLLVQPGDAVITRDVAAETGLQVGDAIVLADLQAGLPVQGYVRGIASDTPNHQGSKIYYTLETATLLANGGPAVNTILVNAPDPASLSAGLEQAGWSTFTAAIAAQNNSSARDLFDTLLKGAGVLGMLVGGIGIANTMQVLLRRRQREIDIWKALGYRELDLSALFAIEAFLLGLVGVGLGILLGVAISTGLVDLFTRTGNLLVSWTFSPYPLLLSGVAGLFTTVLFALWAIAGASQAQPLALLRDEPVPVARLSLARQLGLALLLGIPFTAITGLVMGSLLKGLGVLLFALLGFAVLGGGLGGLAWLTTRLLPLKWLPLANMARISLRRRGKSLVFAMIALFCGVVSIAMGVVVIENATGEMRQHTIEVQGYNLNVVAPYEEEPLVRQAVLAQPVQASAYSYQTQVGQVRALDGESTHTPVLLGFSEAPENYQVSGAAWGSHPQGVYSYTHAQIPPGSQVEVTFKDGSTRLLEVVGVYDYIWGMTYRPPVLGLLAPAGLVAGLAEPDSVTYYIKTNPAEAKSITSALGAALPGATVINMASYLTRYVQTYNNLFVLALAMAGLALLAGVLLVANSVSLAMLERRYEIGILKAVGYSQVHILASLAVEYSLAAAIAVLAGIAAVKILLIVLSILNDLAAGLLVLSPLAAGLILLAGTGLVLGTVAWVTWGPVRVPPAILLNERS